MARSTSAEGDRSRRRTGFAALLALATTVGLASSVIAADPLRWIPSDTRVVFQIDPSRADRQPKARQALGLDAVFAKIVAARLPADRVATRIVAYVNEGTAARPLVLTQGTQPFGKSFEKLHGAKLESAGGLAMYASPVAKDWVVVLVEPAALLEGPRQTVRAVLEHAASSGPSLADAPAGKPARQLLGAGGAASPAAVSLVYLAPDGGKDLYAVLEDLDRILDAEMSTALAAYKSPLRMLGTTHGLRLDLDEAREEIDTRLRLAMPNPMAAKIASVSLLAGKDMAKAASDAAVKAGNMTAEDAGILTTALETLESQADGDQVRVRLRVADGVAQRH
jgi:hypothetical protein